MKQFPNATYTLNGYADSATGTPAFNKELSLNRAQAVVDVWAVSYTHLDPAHANVAFNLQDPSKVSKIVESEYGFHTVFAVLTSKTEIRNNCYYFVGRSPFGRIDHHEQFHEIITASGSPDCSLAVLYIWFQLQAL